MAELSGLKTLTQVVEEYLFLSKKSMDEYFRYQQLAIKGFKKAKLFHLKGFATVVKLVVSAIKTITIPDDYMSFVGVVVPIKGEYWLLTERKAMVFSQTGVTLDADDGEGVDIGDTIYPGYPSVGGVNSEGYIKMDEANNRIIINSLPTSRTEVFLLYVSTGVNAGAATYVPGRITDMLHAYMMWMDKVYTDQSPGAVQMAQRHYWDQVDEVKYLEAPSLQAFKDAVSEVTNPLASR